MNQRRALLLALLASVASALGGYSLHVFADGAPTQQPLFYSGTLEQDGDAVSGDYTLTLTLHDAASGGERLCTSVSEVSVQGGRFRADVSDCADALRAEPDAWVALSFRGSDGVDRDIDGRSKIGAVPYALEAEHAASASATAGGLTTQLVTLEERVAALENGGASKSAFQAAKTLDQTINNWGIVAFDNEVFDLGDEYSTDTNTFTTKEGGYYEISCILSWDIGTHDQVYQWEVTLEVNGSERMYSGFTGDGHYATRQLQGIFKLAPGDRVQCGALGEGAGQKPLNLGGSKTFITFEGRRFAHL